TDDKGKQVEGKAQKAKGEVEDKTGDAKKKLSE
ncbi:TPA_asm: CsbD family protein, partial [Listeria monocytogenes]|nr:CsbD family protein [Listeria monocytogenes]